MWKRIQSIIVTVQCSERYLHLVSVNWMREMTQKKKNGKIEMTNVLISHQPPLVPHWPNKSFEEDFWENCAANVMTQVWSWTDFSLIRDTRHPKFNSENSEEKKIRAKIMRWAKQIKKKFLGDSLSRSVIQSIPQNRRQSFFTWNRFAIANFVDGHSK